MPDFKIPFLGDGITKGDVVKLLVKVGDTVKVDQALFELETDKAVMEVPSDVEGKITNILIKPGDKVVPEQVVMQMEGGAVAVAEKPAAPKAEAPKPAPKPEPVAAKVETVPAPKPVAPATNGHIKDDRMLPAGPAVRRFARELGVDLSQVAGSGPRGRILIEDVKLFVRTSAKVPSAGGATVSAIGPQPLPDFGKWGATHREPMSNVRRATAQKLSRDWSTGPQVTQFDEADVTNIEKLRKQFSPLAEKAGGALTMTAILLKISAAALKVFPQFRGSLDFQSEEVVFKDYYHVGVAVDTERGLLVPVIRDVDSKNLIQLSVELTEAAGRARDRKLALEEMQGSVFTISNLGGIGGTNFTPIVNQPDAAILGVSRAQTKPVWNGKEFEPRRIMPLSLSYDHRLIDGADAARFLRWICQAVEEPFVLSVEG
ncbi:MAG: 2-oxo acid dehydrogenase subunit E2 [Calditrichaeota bacterium]|nr:2-oxo acid dehydrogenase subunit E2 [Calditrichota bacterium]MCB9369379.1 2-oxo acid dehydrogenase subunit E2 [Calditrichota bacterium]